MFNSKISIASFISDYQSKLNKVHNQDKISVSDKYSCLLKKIAQAGNEFDSANEKELTEKVSQILELLTNKISKTEDIDNKKISQFLEKENLIFSAGEDTIDID